MGALDRLFALAGSASVLALAMAAPAAAQQPAGRAGADGNISEIVVTSRRINESLRDVPASVSVLTETMLQSAGVERAEDFINLTPGVTIVDAAEVGDTQVNIRGINGARDAENSFALIIDGILHTNPSALNREFSNLQQIEILKGPQGAIYGRNAAAGAIIITTKEPGNEFEGDAKASIATDETYFASASLSGPVIRDELFFRLHADWRDTEGFFFNSFLDAKNVDSFENYNIDGRLLWEPSADLSVDAKLRYGEVDANAIIFNASFALPAFADLFGVPEFFEDVNDHDFTFINNIVSENEQETVEASVKAEYVMDWATLTAWSFYSDIDQAFSADGTSGAFGFFNQASACRQSVADLFAQGFTLPAPTFLGPTPEASLLGPYTPTACDGTQFQVRNQEDISAEIRLSSPSDQRLRWLGGLYYLHIDRQVGVNLGIDRGQGAIDALFAPPGSANPTEQLVNDEFDSDVYALFGQFAYDFTPDIEASLALRYDREERDVTNLVPTDAVTQFVDFDGPPFDGGAPLNPGLSPIINPSGQIPDRSETFEQVQPKISLSWDATEEITLFASWGIGFKSGGFNNQGSAATIDLFFNQPLGTNIDIDDVFDKETSSAFEVGAKSEFFGGRLRLEAAYYHVNVDDMQFFEFFVGPFGLLRVVSNIDEVRIDGGEFAVSARPLPWLDVYAGVNIIDSEIKENAVRPITVGNESPYTPDYTVNGGVNFTVPLGGDVELVARADALWVGPTWFHTVQGEQTPTIFGAPADWSRARRDDYVTLDARAGLQTPTWSLIAFARNAFDTDYLEEVIPAIEFGGSFIAPGPRGRYGIEAAVRF